MSDIRYLCIIFVLYLRVALDMEHIVLKVTSLRLTLGNTQGGLTKEYDDVGVDNLFLTRFERSGKE